MIDFRSLSYFLVACEHENLGSAAKVLEIAPSTLSASLKALEAGFGTSLFRRQGAGLAPRQLAHWLYRAAVPLLLLEAFTCRRVLLPSDEPATLLKVDILLRFAFGQFRRALANAITETALAEPLTLVDPHWPKQDEVAFGTAILDQLKLENTHNIRIEAVAGAVEPGAGDVVLRQDPWMVVRKRYSAEDVYPDRTSAKTRTLMVPALPQGLVEQVVAHARVNGMAVEVLNTPPDDWPQLLDKYPGASLLLPESAIAARLGLTKVEVQPLEPALQSAIVAKSDGSPTALRFLTRLKTAFDRDRPSTPFTPVLTGRRLRYFSLAYELGRVSAAARAASVAQPAMSQQLRKLEESLGIPLFERRAFGLIRTKASAQFALAASLLDKRLRELEVSGATASLAEGGRLSIGVLPSVSHHGYLIGKITATLISLCDLYPAMSVAVREGPNGVLQSLVQRGTIGLAIVEAPSSQMPRMGLDAAEPLAVIANPNHELLPPGPVRFSDLPSVPLILPTALFGLRQLVDSAARDAGIDIVPLHEIDALSMLVPMLIKERVATIMPASAVRPELLAGELVAHIIVEPTIDRRLFVIYSADRSLTPVERDLVRLLRVNLSDVPS